MVTRIDINTYRKSQDKLNNNINNLIQVTDIKALEKSQYQLNRILCKETLYACCYCNSFNLSFIRYVKRKYWFPTSKVFFNIYFKCNSCGKGLYTLV